MRIAVYSPLWRTGTTTVASLLSLLLANTQGLEVCMLETGERQSRLTEILGVPEVEDITRTVSQILKRLESNEGIPSEELPLYARKVSTKLDLFSIVDRVVDRNDSDKLVKYLYESLPYEIIVTDVRTNLFDEISDLAFDTADIIIAVLEQDSHMYAEFKTLMSDDKFESWADKTLYVINQFSPYASSVKEIRSALDIPKTRMTTVAYNPYIQKTQIKGVFPEIVPYVLNKDFRVMELVKDADYLTKLVTVHLGIKYKPIGGSK